MCCVTHTQGKNVYIYYVNLFQFNIPNVFIINNFLLL